MYLVVGTHLWASYVRGYSINGSQEPAPGITGGRYPVEWDKVVNTDDCSFGVLESHERLALLYAPCPRTK